LAPRATPWFFEVFLQGKLLKCIEKNNEKGGFSAPFWRFDEFILDLNLEMRL